MTTTSRGIFGRFVTALVLIAGSASSALGQGGETLTPLQIEKDPIAWMGGKNVVAVARVSADGAEFRSGPDPNYRVVRRADAGTLVLVVDYHPNHYCEILVPTGYRAYVHNRFMQVDDDGLGRCHEERVNVRSIPSSQGDYPIGQIGPGDVLLVWGKVGTDQDWFEVTPPGRLTVYVEDTSLDLVGAMDDAISAEIAAARGELYDRFAANSEDTKAKAAAKEAEARLREEFESVLAAIDTQRARGPDAEYDALAEELTRLGTATDDSDLLREIETQRELLVTLTSSAERERLLRDQEEADRLAEAQRALAAKTNPVATPAVPATAPVAAAGTSGEWIGFLRSRPENGGLAYSIEQGARALVKIDVSSRRYRWNDFVGLQVRIHGRVTQPGGVPVVDVTKLEIQR
jgi:hypothetical protein